MAVTDEKVVSGEIKLPDGPGHERQKVAIVGGGVWELLERRRDDAVRFNRRAQAPRHMQERKNIRLREEIAKDLQHLFASAHAGEPILDDRDAARAHEACLGQVLPPINQKIINRLLHRNGRRPAG